MSVHRLVREEAGLGDAREFRMSAELVAAQSEDVITRSEPCHAFSTDSTVPAKSVPMTRILGFVNPLSSRAIIAPLRMIQ